PEAAPSLRRTRWPAARWIEHYRDNARGLIAIPWEERLCLSEAQRAVLLPSLQVFQQGEDLEGRHFFRCVKDHADRTGDTDYVEAHSLFMAEEKRHAAMLGRFLTLAGVPLLTERSFLSRLFCWAGSRGGLEPTLVVVLMVEVMAQVYFRALWHATDSQILR